jgi:F-type H+-transporting ATPase subunit b
MEILNQLGVLVLGSVPTAILLVLLVILYGVLVRRPLEATLAERRNRTSGAVEQARKAIEAAEAETAAYEAKLRAVRAEIAAARDQRMKQLVAERDAVLESARSSAQGMVRTAKAEIEASSTAALRQIEDATGELSDRILRAILPSGSNQMEASK